MLFNTQECGVTFSTNNWEIPVNLIVTGYVDNVYNTDDRTGHIRLKIEEGSSTGLSGVWDTVNIPDIQMLFTQSSDGLRWYSGWAIFNVWVHVCLITALDPTHSTGTDVVIGMVISSPSNTSYAFFSGFAKTYVRIMTKMSKRQKIQWQKDRGYQLGNHKA
jgi:hypothetical protein